MISVGNNNDLSIGTAEKVLCQLLRHACSTCRGKSLIEGDHRPGEVTRQNKQRRGNETSLIREQSGF